MLTIPPTLWFADMKVSESRRVVIGGGFRSSQTTFFRSGWIVGLPRGRPCGMLSAMRARAIIAVAVVLGLAGPAAADEDLDYPSLDEVNAKLLSQLRADAGCGTPAARPALCVAIDGWAGGTAAPLPVGSVLVGVTYVILGNQVAKAPADPQAMVSLLAVRSVRGKARRIELTVQTIDSGNEAADRQVIPRLVAAIARGKGSGAAALAHTRVDLALVRDLASQEYRRADRSWQWRTCEDVVVELRKVGERWVAIQTAGAGWHAITVFAPR